MYALDHTRAAELVFALRQLPLGQRKKRLARLLSRAQVGVVLNEHTDENSAVVFLPACRMGLEGIVSKRLTAPYRSGRSADWIKVKNPDSPAMVRHGGATVNQRAVRASPGSSFLTS